MGVLKIGGKSFLWGWDRERSKARKKLDRALAESAKNGVAGHYLLRSGRLVS